MRARGWIVSVSVMGLVGLIAGAAVFPRAPALPTAVARKVAAYPHDAAAFSQGLAIHEGQLFEGTGQYGESSVRKVDLTTGRIQQLVPLNKDYFGEGITVLGNRLYQITWKERLCLVYDVATLQVISSFRYTGQGWGLTHDGRELYMSDGSSTIRCLNPETFEVQRRLEVRAGRNRIDKLNELEFVNGELLANIWYSDRIARISPKTGEVLGWIDASSLYPAHQRPSREHVLNGIAFDTSTQRLYLTGKNWPELFEVELVPQP